MNITSIEPQLFNTEMEPMANWSKIPTGTTDEFQFEEHCNVLDDAMNELKKYLDRVLEMRLQCAELEIELATLYKPDLTQKIMTCQKTCTECKGLIFGEVKDAEMKKEAS